MKRFNLPFCSLLVLLTSVVALESCQPASDAPILVNERLELPETNLEYDRSMPTHISWNGGIPFASPAQDVNAVATLGRVLFYDRKLSFNNTTSCSSCHLAHLGFADGQQVSTGMQNTQTKRNAPGIANLAFESEFFWDGRRNDLEAMVLDPVQDHVEMGLSNLDAVVSKLSHFEEYQSLFSDAFGSPEITEMRMRTALSDFIRSMVSADTKFDQWTAGTANFNGQELRGKELFDQHCQTCHGGGSFGGWGWANIGLDEDYQDQGVGEWQNWDGANGAFLIPQLRNVAVTGPYMHDGRFATLEEVIDHYDQNIVLHENLDYRLIDFSTADEGSIIDLPFGGIGGDWAEMGVSPRRLDLSGADKAALVAFLETLTDEELMTAERFQNPWMPAE